MKISKSSRSIFGVAMDFKITRLGAGENYRPALDGVRAIAIILVLAQHLDGNQVPFGFLGVDVFFVLSGYVIYLNYFSKPKFSYKIFLCRRFNRLYPVLLLVLAVNLLVPSLRHMSSPQEFLECALYLKNFMGWPWPLGPFWSLSAEEQFYIISGIICVFIQARTLGTRKSILLTIISCLTILNVIGMLHGILKGEFNTSSRFNLVIYRPSEIAFGVLAGIFSTRARQTASILNGRTCDDFFFFSLPQPPFYSKYQHLRRLIHAY